MQAIADIKFELNAGTDFVKVTRNFVDKNTDEKWIPMSDMLTLLMNSTTGNHYVEIGELPFGYIRGAKDASTMDTFLVALKLPPEKRLLIYYDDEYLVPFPELLFEFAVKNGKVQSSKVFSILHKRGKNLMASYPFGNVYSDGTICWGTNILPAISEMKQTELILGMFFGASTNNDLYLGGSSALLKEVFMNQKGLILELVKRKKFPEKWLITKSPMRTLEEEMEMFFNTYME